MATDKLGRSFVFKGFRKKLNEQFGEETATSIWQRANATFIELEQKYPDITGDSRMMILPAAALYLALREQAPEQVDLLKEYGAEIGEKIARIIHGVTSIPGVPQLL